MKISIVTILSLVLAALFFPACHPDVVVHSNDGSLGIQMADQLRVKPGGYGILWTDLNWLGGQAVGPTPVSITGFLNTPGLPFISMLTIAFFSAWYKPSRYRIYRWFGLIVTVALSIVCLTCAMIGLFYEERLFYIYPWMFFLAPCLVGWILTLSICHIITLQAE